jgi:hypothetical protein
VSTWLLTVRFIASEVIFASAVDTLPVKSFILVACAEIELEFAVILASAVLTLYPKELKSVWLTFNVIALVFCTILLSALVTLVPSALKSSWATLVAIKSAY